MEDLGDSGRHVVLDHRLSDLMILLDALAPDHERSLDLIGGVTSMTITLMTVVGADDEDRVVVDSSLFGAFDNPAYAVVNLRKLSHVLSGTLTIGVAHVVESVDVDEADHRLLLLDVLGALLNDGVRML